MTAARTPDRSPAVTLPEPNIPLLRKAVEWAEAEAAKTDGTCLWNQREYVVEYACETTYCIAGWAVAVSPVAQFSDDSIYDWPTVNGERMSWHEAGRLLLGLTDFEALSLFDDANDIADVRSIAEEIAARAGERL